MFRHCLSLPRQNVFVSGSSTRSVLRPFSTEAPFSKKSAVPHPDIGKWTLADLDKAQTDVNDQKDQNVIKEKVDVARRLASLLPQYHSIGSRVSSPAPGPTDLPLFSHDITLEALLKATCHLGHTTSAWHPRMLPYIFGTRAGIHIIDLEQTIAHLRRASSVIREIAYRGGLIAFVGTRTFAHSIAVQAGHRSGSYFLERWVPGTITNRYEILGKYSKLKLNQSTSGVAPEFQKSLEHSEIVRKPDLVVLLSVEDNSTAVKECQKELVPTIGIIDTDCDPRWVTYPIPANDDSPESVGIISHILSWAAKEGRLRRLATLRNRHNGTY